MRECSLFHPDLAVAPGKDCVQDAVSRLIGGFWSSSDQNAASFSEGGVIWQAPSEGSSIGWAMSEVLGGGGEKSGWL